ncbi:MAG TPA: hypothetical protein VLK85_19480, partial [Ramlibacter sp.]|nr:hypothetical protein [Ramlibacter sp.]
MREFNQPSETFGPYDPGGPVDIPDRSTAARQTAVAIEDAIRRDVLETGVFVASDGRELLRRTGQPDRVRYLVSELAVMAGTTFVHNHPGRAGPSVDDVVLAAEFGLHELRVVTDLFRYAVMGMTNVSIDNIQAAYHEMESKLAAQLREQVRLGSLH